MFRPGANVLFCLVFFWFFVCFLLFSVCLFESAIVEMCICDVCSKIVCRQFNVQSFVLFVVSNHILSRVFRNWVSFLISLCISPWFVCFIGNGSSNENSDGPGDRGGGLGLFGPGGLRTAPLEKRVECCTTSFANTKSVVGENRTNACLSWRTFQPCMKGAETSWRLFEICI